MNIEEMLIVVGGRNLIVRRHQDATDDVIFVSDPLKFITLMGVDEGWATVREAPTPSPRAEKKDGRNKPLAKSHKEAVSRGVKRFWAKVHAGQLPNPNADRGKAPSPAKPKMLTTNGAGGRDKPRLGSLHITEEEAERAREAVVRRDAALSQLEQSVLRLRLGVGSQPPLKVRDIQQALQLRTHTQVVMITRRALRMLGIRPHGRKRGRRG